MANLTERVRNILLRPTSEWAVIDGEAASIEGLFTGYAAVLAMIPAVAALIGGLLFTRAGLIGVLVDAILAFVLSLAAVFVEGLIFDALAPSFGAQRNRMQALKLAVYSATPGWIAGALDIIPRLSPLAGLVGLYGLYVLYRGLPVLMKSPPEKTTAYFLVSVAVLIVVYFVMAIMTVVPVFLFGRALGGGVAASH